MHKRSLSIRFKELNFRKKIKSVKSAQCCSNSPSPSNTPSSNISQKSNNCNRSHQKQPSNRPPMPRRLFAGQIINKYTSTYRHDRSSRQTPKLLNLHKHELIETENPQSHPALIPQRKNGAGAVWHVHDVGVGEEGPDENPAGIDRCYEFGEDV